jgi:hypothetical protein
MDLKAYRRQTGGNAARRIHRGAQIREEQEYSNGSFCSSRSLFPSPRGRQPRFSRRAAMHRLRIRRIVDILDTMSNIRAAHMCHCCWMRSQNTGRAGDGIGARARVTS